MDVELTEANPPRQPKGSKIVVIGGSAGGIPALIGLLSSLPTGFSLPILVVQHLSPTMSSRLPEVLGWNSKRTVKWAENNERMRPGAIYVAPPDQHLRVGQGHRTMLSSEARVGRWRPAIDVLFQSAAELYGEGVVAVVLSGAMWDGAKGIASVIRCGGITIAQDEATSGHFDMPAAAIDFGRADLIMRPEKMAAALQVLDDGLN